MISFKSFINAIQEAIINASDVLMDKNVSLLDKYFVESPKQDSSTEDPTAAAKHTLVPKNVVLEYPHLNSAGDIENLEVSVPLITLVPLSMTKIDKATLTASFKMAMVNDEVQLDLGNDDKGFLRKKPKTTWAKVEISFSPQETPEGYKLLVEGYEAILKKQIT